MRWVVLWDTACNLNAIILKSINFYCLIASASILYTSKTIQLALKSKVERIRRHKQKEPLELEVHTMSHYLHIVKVTLQHVVL